MRRNTQPSTMATVGAAVGIAAGLAGMVALAAPATAKGQGAQVALQDDCDRNNWAPVPGGCTKNGKTTFTQLVDSLLANGSNPKWRNDPVTITVKAGEPVYAFNQGGEWHTFSEVAEFGGGCVDQVNQWVRLEAVPECKDPAKFPGTIVTQGSLSTPVRLTPGVHTFQCLIHPWMHTVVMVTGTRMV